VLDRVRFVGQVQAAQMIRYYIAADALVLMPARKGMPNAVLEDGHEVIGVDIGQSKLELIGRAGSPIVEKLIGKGVEFEIYDPEVNTARLPDANRRYIETAIPHISKLLRGSPVEVVRW
jgi:hypothetical protein